MLEETERQVCEGLARDPTEQGRPGFGRTGRKPPEGVGVRVARRRGAIDASAGRGVTDKAQETHKGEKRLAREHTGPKCPVEVEGGERLWRSRQAEAHVAALGADSHEGIEERKRASHVLPGRERLDVANLGEQRIQFRRADLPLDPRRRTHQVAPLAVRLDPPCRPVLREPATEVSGLANVEKAAVDVVEMVDTRDGGDAGEEVSAELSVEEVHRSLVGAIGPHTQ